MSLFFFRKRRSPKSTRTATLFPYQTLFRCTSHPAAPGFSQVYFRGVASGENANHSASLPKVCTYLDEMLVTTIQGALDIHAYDLARVEALAGPSGTLYGASSMDATSKLVTNQPDYSGSYEAMDLELTSVAQGEFGGIADGFYNAKLLAIGSAQIRKRVG